MELKNKVINFLGDSITEGVGASCGETRYVDQVAALASLARANNYGISGTRIARQKKPDFVANRFDLDFCLRCVDMDKDADINVVFGGTNDFGHGDAPIGTPDDRTPETFWGACHYLCRTLLETYPDAVTVICTPLHRLSENTPAENSGLVLEEYAKIIRTVAEYYSLPVLDLWKMGGMQPAVGIIQQKYMPDGLHPNDAGHLRLAERIVGFLGAL